MAIETDFDDLHYALNKAINRCHRFHNTLEFVSLDDYFDDERCPVCNKVGTVIHLAVDAPTAKLQCDDCNNTFEVKVDWPFETLEGILKLALERIASEKNHECQWVYVNDDPDRGACYCSICGRSGDV